MKIILFLSLLFLGINSEAQCESFTVDVLSTNPTCPNYSDGCLEFYISGGTPPYTVIVTDSEGVIVDLAGGSPCTLIEGTYDWEAEDSDGCLLNGEVEFVDPDELIIELTITPETDFSECDGTVEVDTVLGWQGVYADIYFVWSPGGPAGLGEVLFSEVCGGNYEIEIVDYVGCGTSTEFTMGTLAGLQDLGSNFRIRYHSNQIEILSEEGEFMLYSLTGRLLESTKLASGMNRIPFQPIGVVFYQIQTGNEVRSGKLNTTVF